MKGKYLSNKDKYLVKQHEDLLVLSNLLRVELISGLQSAMSMVLPAISMKCNATQINAISMVLPTISMIS